ncbi:MAG: tRNA (5-methylaminomethyl-2-thiouridine)(34)-methyltransferase MnmD [Weeksellaceae bacterium]
MLKRKLISTDDGSVTIFLPEWNESYHSKHGAVRESIHVFIQNGLDKILNTKISILEIGFGTGLNSFLTLLNAIKKDINISYTGLEKFPVQPSEYQFLNYSKSIVDNTHSFDSDEIKLDDLYQKLMASDWGNFQEINHNFRLKKVETDFFEFDYPESEFDLVYFDAFGARVQPELWTSELLEKIYFGMKSGALLTTYSSKGSVRRTLKELGFEVEKMAGPPGKREMINAIKK